MKLTSCWRSRWMKSNAVLHSWANMAIDNTKKMPNIFGGVRINEWMWIDLIGSCVIKFTDATACKEIWTGSEL